MKKLLFFFVFTPFIFSAQTLTLQPDGVNGKDALLLGCLPCGFATTNYGNHGDVTAAGWTNSSNDSPARSIIEFDLSAIPANAVVTSAFLSLYYNPNATSITAGHQSLQGSNEALIQRVTSDWDELTITWNNQPATTTSNQVTLPESISSSQNYTDINVTNLVQDMVNNPTSSFGFLLRVVDESPYKKLTFASSDNANSNLRPKLVVNYLDVTSVDELNGTSNEPVTLLKIVDSMGREVNQLTSNLLFYIYSDGTVKKIVRTEL